jgi:hypothetical protein
MTLVSIPAPVTVTLTTPREKDGIETEFIVPRGCIYNINDIVLPLRTFMRRNDRRLHQVFASIDIDGNKTLSGQEFCSAVSLLLNVNPILQQADFDMVSEAFVAAFGADELAYGQVQEILDRAAKPKTDSRRAREIADEVEVDFETRTELDRLQFKSRLDDLGIVEMEILTNAVDDGSGHIGKARWEAF